MTFDFFLSARPRTRRVIRVVRRKAGPPLKNKKKKVAERNVHRSSRSVGTYSAAFLPRSFSGVNLWRTTGANVEKVTPSDEIYERAASARRRVKTMTPPLSQGPPDSPRTGGILIVTIVGRSSGFRPFSTRRRPAVGKIIVFSTTHASNEDEYPKWKMKKTSSSFLPLTHALIGLCR